MKTKGLQFKKFDLHVHTPASECFFNKQVTPEKIVEKAIQEDLSAIAITDHNSGEWIDKVKKIAKGKKLVVFPGVEITVGDAHNHVIAVLDVNKGTKDIEGLLSNLGILPNKQGKSDAFTNKSVNKVINIITGKDFDGIAILAHIDSSNGVFEEMTGEQRTEVIQNPNLLAAEACKYKKTFKLLDGSDSTYQRKLAVYQASDNPCLDKNGKIDTQGPKSGKHCLEGIGFRYSYFKVDEKITLESIRQCFIDPDVRIRQSFEYKKGVYPYIKKVNINSGFLVDEEFEFHHGLNSILGAKGVGKSLLIEFMRFGLNQQSTQPEIRRDHNEKLSNQLGQYGQVELYIIDETGKEYKISRTYDPTEENSITCLDISQNEVIDVNLAQLFPVLFLSQTEIIKIAEDKNEQLKFIDKFFDFHMYQNRIINIESEINEIDKEFADSLRAFHEEKTISNQLKTIDLEIKKLTEQLKNPVFEQYAKLEKKDRVFRVQYHFLKSILEISNVFENDIKIKDLPKIPNDLSADPALKRTQVVLKTAISDLLNNISAQKEKINKHLTEISSEYSKWKPIFEEREMEFKEEIIKLGGDFQQIEEKRKVKLKEKEKLEERKILITSRAKKIKEIHLSRNIKLDELKKAYTEYFKARKSKCEFLEKKSNGRLQVIMKESTNKEEFIKILSSLKKGSYLRDFEIDKLCDKISPYEFVLNLLRYDLARVNGKDNAKKYISNISSKTKISDEKIKNLIDHLLNTKTYEELLLLQYKAFPQDRPEIKYNLGDKHNKNYVPLKNVSTGQKSTALVIISLSEGIMPIIIDQPEDSLDIRAIWEDMCTKLRKGKELRQFIFSTHNSSVAVASDTDKFTIMTASATKGEVLYSGSLDNKKIKEEVLQYLEGGLPTYKLKFDKYNIPKVLK